MGEDRPCCLAICLAGRALLATRSSRNADGALIMWTLTTPQAIVFLLLVAVPVTLGWLLVQ